MKWWGWLVILWGGIFVIAMTTTITVTILVDKGIIKHQGKGEPPDSGGGVIPIPVPIGKKWPTNQ